jgi:hypothetical protein
MDETLIYYILYRGTIDNPRLKQWQLRKKSQKMGLPMNQKTIAKYLKKGRDQYIILDPKLIIYNHENLLHRIYLLQSDEPITGIERIYTVNKEKITHVIGGGNNFNIFIRSREDIDTLDFPVVFKGYCGDYIQTIPQKSSKEDSVLAIGPSLNRGKYSLNSPSLSLKWDSKDWEIYKKIAYNPRISFAHIARELDLHQTTVKLRFIEHIAPPTYWLSGYFEKGYLAYTGVMIQVKTLYEHGLYERFSHLSATSYFLKTEGDWLFILVYVIDVKQLIKYFNGLLDQDLIDEFRYTICYDYLPKRE